MNQVIGDIDNLLARFLNDNLDIVEKSRYRFGLGPQGGYAAELLAIFLSGRTGIFIDQADRSDAKIHRGLRVGLSCDCMQLKSTWIWRRASGPFLLSKKCFTYQNIGIFIFYCWRCIFHEAYHSCLWMNEGFIRFVKLSRHLDCNYIQLEQKRAASFPSS